MTDTAKPIVSDLQIQAARDEATEIIIDTNLTTRELLEQRDQLQQVYSKTQHEIKQVLGKALGNYPWYKDDQKNFPSATDADGVCVGEHVAETIAEEAANVIVQLKEQRDELRDALFALQMAFIKINGCFPLPYSSGHQEMTQAQSALAKCGKEQNK